MWRPISVAPFWRRMQTEPRSRGADALMVIGRLAPAATFDSAQAEMNTIAARLREAYPNDNAGRGVMIEPLTDRVIGARTMRALWLLFAAVGFVLLIACANVANLALARGTARHNEFSLRTALGASRWRLIRQALAESLVLALLGAAAGVGFAWLITAALRTWAADALPRMDTLRLDLNVFLFALAAAVLCGLFAGLLPAWLLSMAKPADALREGGPRSHGGRATRRMRNGLVVAEIALAVVLLSGGGLLIRSFARVQATDRGFDSGNVLLLQIDPTDRFEQSGDLLSGGAREDSCRPRRGGGRRRPRLLHRASCRFDDHRRRQAAAPARRARAAADSRQRRARLFRGDAHPAAARTPFSGERPGVNARAHRHHQRRPWRACSGRARIRSASV